MVSTARLGVSDGHTDVTANHCNLTTPSLTGTLLVRTDCPRFSPPQSSHRQWCHCKVAGAIMRRYVTCTLTFVSLTILWTVFASQAQAATTIHVPADQPTIQDAINAASNGDTVLVSP